MSLWCCLCLSVFPFHVVLCHPSGRDVTRCRVEDVSFVVRTCPIVCRVMSFDALYDGM